MKRTYTVTLLLLITLSFFIINPCNAEIYIETLSPAYIIDNTGEHITYTTIQEAIDQAPTDSTIYVTAGTYTEILTINKPLTLQGGGKETTILAPTSNKNSYAINIRSPEVTIEGFTICNNGPGLYTTAIKITSCKVIIKDCILKDTPVGIAIWGSENTITRCTFSGCSDEGIFLVGTIDSECTNNIIDSCTFTNNGDGIEASNAHATRIFRCTFTKNIHDGISFIGNVKTNYGNTITQCIITDNNVHGIYLSGTKNEIKSCTLSNNNNGNIVLTANSMDNDIQTTQEQPSSHQMNHQPIRNILTIFSSYIQRMKLRII